MMRLFELNVGNWSTVLVVTFILGVVYLYVFTTALFTVFLGMAFLAVILFFLYYLGVRIDRRLRYGKSKSPKPPSNSNPNQTPQTQPQQHTQVDTGSQGGQGSANSGENK